MDEEPHYVSETVVPTTSQLEALKRHIATTKALKIKRLGEFTETKLLIIQVLRVDGSEHIPSGRRLSLVKLDFCCSNVFPNSSLAGENLAKAARPRQLGTLE